MATSATTASSGSSNYFTGNSTFSADLNNQIAHAVAVATLPITTLQNQQSTLTGQQTELQTLGSDFTTLRTALGAIDNAVSSGSLAATVDNGSVASANISKGALSGSYSVAITNLGSQTNTISSPSVTSATGAISADNLTAASFTLSVGSSTYSLTSGSTLANLVTAINGSGAGVQASVVNNQLSIQGASASAIQLTAASAPTTNLLTDTTAATGVTSVADPTSGNISTSSTFTLTVGGTPYSLTPASTSLDSLVTAINASGANVQATIVNVGGSSSPNYELSVQGTQLAATTIQLSDGTNSLLSTQTTGSPVAYSVNGQASVTSSTRSLAISTGLTVTALATGTANVTVAESGSGVESALSALVTSFNAATDELTANHGQNGGALGGQSVILQLGSVLHSLTNYSGSSSGSIQSLADVGLSFDTNGHLQFDSSVFASASASSLSNVMTFLGSETANTGFLGAASTALTSVTDTTNGLIVQDISSIASTVASLTTTISNDQTRLTLMQSNLTAQMEAADSAVAELQSQTTEITDMFAAQQVQTQANALA